MTRRRRKSQFVSIESAATFGDVLYSLGELVYTMSWTDARIHLQGWRWRPENDVLQALPQTREEHQPLDP